MARVKIRAQNSNVLGHAYINIINPEINNGYWVDEQGKQIVQAYLGETLRFKLATKDLKGKTLLLSLYDSQKETFNGTIKETIRVSTDSFVFSIKLDKEWNDKLLQNGGKAFLYWDIKVKEYPNVKKRLPDKKEDYLEIRPKCLYVNSYGKDNLPYIYSRSGEKLSLGELSGKASSAIKDVLKDDIDRFKDNAFEYFITRNEGTKIAKGLKVFRKVLNAADKLEDTKDIVNMVLTKGKSVSDMTLPLVGPYYPIAVAAKLVIDDMDEDIKEFCEKAELEKLNHCIEEGLWTVRNYVSDIDPYENKYKLINISVDVFIDILNGKFNSLNEVERTFMSQTEYDRDIVMLCYTFDRDEIAITIIRAFFTENI